MLGVIIGDTMNHILLVALGGALGSVARFKVSELLLLSYPSWKFPIGTFIVNVLGCLTIGILAGLSERPGVISPDVRLFLFTGVMGGFTTFSAFGLETFSLLKRGEILIASSYVGLSIIVGILAVCVGFVIVAGTAK